MHDHGGDLTLIRHGETMWSRSGQHTGRTDIPLTEHGEDQARSLTETVASLAPTHILTSPAIRARRTAELAGLRQAAPEPLLWEWDYGAYDGLTTPEIQRERPGWDLWSDGVVSGDDAHPGETVEQVGARIDLLLDRVRTLLADGNVVLVAHAHVLRVLGARWLGLPPDAGRLFRLSTATLSTLGTEHGRPAMCSWNVPAAAPSR